MGWGGNVGGGGGGTFSWCLQERVEPGLKTVHAVTQLSQPSRAVRSSLFVLSSRSSKKK